MFLAKAFLLISEKMGLMSNGELEQSFRGICKQGKSSEEAYYSVELHKR